MFYRCKILIYYLGLIGGVINSSILIKKFGSDLILIGIIKEYSNRPISSDLFPKSVVRHVMQEYIT